MIVQVYGKFTKYYILFISNTEDFAMNCVYNLKLHYILYLEFDDRKPAISALFSLWNCINLYVITFYNKINKSNS